MQKLHLLGLTGMNYGNANTLGFEDTGEQTAISYVRDKLKERKILVFFDVGANAGAYTRLVSKILHNKMLVIFAFEPVAYTYHQLQNNTEGIPNIKCFNFGLSDKEESVNIYSNYETSGATTLYARALESFSFNKNLSEKILLKTLDSVCANEEVDTIDFLKIDVEGHEYKVLQGAIALLAAKKIKFIQFEFGPFNIYSRIFFKDFWELLSPAYTIFRIVRNGLFEIRSYSENLEIFRTANFLAELKEHATM